MRQLKVTSRFRQRGIVLLLIVLTLLAIGGAVLLTGLAGGKTAERRFAEGETADQRLVIARDALLGYAVGKIEDGRPGQLPAPDSLRDDNYDGTANNIACLDGTAVNGLPALASDNANSRCLGKLPWKTLGISSDGVDQYDSTGIIPWYAVSANLSASNLCLTYINPSTVAAAPVTYACPSDTAPPFPWLKVCDQTGKLLSDRVAFVLFVPGAAIVTMGRTQTRNGSPRPQPSDYLDAIPVPTGWSALPTAQRCTTYDNAALSNEFVTADTITGFNDRLLYVTVDELMSRLENRVAVELREAVRNFQKPSGRNAYPWLVPLTDPTSPASNFAVPNTLAGFVPFHTTHTDQSFLSELGWTMPTGAAGSPTSSSPTFTCFGTSNCRLRTTSGAAIPNTVTAAAVNAMVNYDISSPVATCKWTSNANKEAKCSHTFVTGTTAATYRQERNVSGTWTYVGDISGTQTRSVNVDFGGFIGTAGSSVAATGTSVLKRSVTDTGSTSGWIRVEDTFIDSSGAMTTAVLVGTRETAGIGAITVRSVRAYPVMPAWYFAHKWNEYSFAVLSSDVSPTLAGVNCSANCLESGTRTNLDAIVAVTGAPLTGQNRNQVMPPVASFLEDLNVTGVSVLTPPRKFNAVGNPKTNAYNDAIATLPP